MSVSDYSVHGNMAVIAMNSPPVNGLGLPLRTGIRDGLDRAAADAQVRAVVLIGAQHASGGPFSGGADIREFNTPKMLAEPNLHTLIEQIEQMGKPVIAAISGPCMGGGLELALGCHYRVARVDAQIALPEVNLGLLPGGGGTQRLPRVVGVETALKMIVSGASVPAKQLAATQLFDAVTEGELLPAALELAAKIVAEQRPLKRVRDIKPSAADAAYDFTAARAQARGPFPAPLACVDAVAAAVTSATFDAGMEAERKGFSFLVDTPESRAQRHAFFGERAASKIADVPDDTPLRPIRSAAVIGAGTMGGGL
ncbi:MAG TPA: enoyl-CoA hydratase-related protein, partial [Fontimonas sp.]